MNQQSYNIAELTALVVDDHPPIRKAIKSLLVKMGFVNVLEASDGIQAIEQLGEQVVDIVILDLYMRRSGFEVIEFVRSKDVGSDIPIIVVTGEASKEDIVKASDLGADDYVVKPFHTPDLEKKIQTLLAKYSLPDETTKHIRIAERMLQQGNHMQSLAKIDDALAVDANSLRARHIKSIALFRCGRASEAVQILQEGTRLNASFYKNFVTLADIYLTLGRHKEAADAIIRELEFNPKNPRRQAQVGKLLYDAGNLEGATNHYREALKIDAKFPIALMGMGHVYAAAQNLDKAIYYFKRLRRYRPTATKALEAIVKVAIDFEQPKRAEHALRDERNQHPEREDTYLVLARFYATQDNEEGAITILEQLMTKKPDSAAGLTLLSEIAVHFKNMLLAADALDRLSKLPEGHTYETIQRLAEMLLRTGNVDKAIERAQEAIGMSRNHGRTLIVLAECYLKSSQMTKAHFLFRRIEQLGLMSQKMSDVAQRCRAAILQRRQQPKRIA